MNRRTFNSNEFVFRPSTMSEALRRAGMDVPMNLVREQKFTATVRQKNDRFNIRPSVTIHLRSVTV